MKRLSLLKFSRYFLVLFLAGTAAPLLGLMFWTSYQMNQLHRERHRHFLELISLDLREQVQAYRQRERARTARIAESLRDTPPLTLANYRILLDTPDVWWLDSSQAVRFLREEGHLDLRRRFDGRQVVNDYGLNRQRTLTIVSIIPVLQSAAGNGQTSRRTLLAARRVPLTVFIPPGPHHGEFFAGSDLRPASRIAVVESLPPHKRLAQLKGAPPPRSDEIFGRKPPPLSPEARLIPIDAQNGRRVATIRLQLREMPHPEEESSRWLGVLILLTGLLSSLVAGWYIHRNFILPLMRLSMVTRRVQDGDLSGRIDTGDVRQAEVLHTLRNFNAMLDQLDEKERLRNNFVSNLTHDFRTPLIAQARALELLLRDFGTDDPESSPQARLAHSLLHNNRHLLGMVNQLLETYQFEEGQLTLHLETLSLPRLVERCFDALLALAATRNITLSREFPGDFPDIIGDPACLSRVFINLIANAIENIPKGSRIQVFGESLPPTLTLPLPHSGIHIRKPRSSATAVDQGGGDLISPSTGKKGHLISGKKEDGLNPLPPGLQPLPRNEAYGCGSPNGGGGGLGWGGHAGVEIHVRDNGQGIPPEECAHLFDRYYAGLGDTRKLGSGLGLYICKMFVEAHGGDIQVDSEPGAYTDFRIRLPLSPPAGKDDLS